MSDYPEDLITLPSGLVMNANLGFIGINAKMEVCEGYDGGTTDQDFTPDQKRELADRMIALWRQYREQA